jgi:hypothetical protein
MTERQLLDKIHRRLAEITIGSSALRNQGGPGIVQITRSYLYQEIKPNDIFSRLESKRRLINFLDRHTIQLADAFPTDFQNWGAARKALNLFLREVVYNKFLSERYGLSINFEECNSQIEYLEVPLDGHVAKGIKERVVKNLPVWEGIRNLTPIVSKLYQDAAMQIAEEEGVARIHLDLILWRPDNEN